MPSIADGKFVVVGGASLLGSHIGEHLLEGGAREVLSLDNLSLGSTDAIDFLRSDPRFRFVRGDALRLHELLDAFTDVDGVFLVAGFLGGPMAENPWLGIDVNVRGTQNVLEAARQKSVGKVVFSSSVGIYGAIGDEPNSDDSPLRWQGLQPGVILYCTAKIMGEGLGRLYHQRYGLGFLALRYSSMYGERQHRRAFATTQMVDAYERIAAGKPAIIEGDGTQVQDYVYVGDVARANLMAMESGASGDGFNIVSGEDTAQNVLVGFISKACGSDLRPEYHVDPAKLSMPREARQGYSRERAAELIGWEPRVTIEDGVSRLVRWLDQQRAPGPGTGR